MTEPCIGEALSQIEIKSAKRRKTSQKINKIIIIVGSLNGAFYDEGDKKSFIG